MTTSGFNERYQRWKNGEQVYYAGRIKPLNTLKYAPWSLEQWKDDIQQYKGINTDDKSYDYDRFFKENPKAAWGILNDRPDAHFTDIYKGSFHPSASNGSVYSGKYDSVFNPKAKQFGTWYGDHLYRAPKNPDASWDNIIDNAIYNEPGGLTVVDYNYNLPYLRDGSFFGGSLPEITVTRNKKLSVPKPQWRNEN